MGNESSTNKISIDREVYRGKLDYYNNLESTNNELVLKITQLHDQIEQLKRDKANEMIEKNKLKSELLKYESQPIIQCVTTIFNQITEEEENINKLLNKRTSKNPTIYEEINKLKASINNNCSNLPNKVTSSLLDTKIDEIRQLEAEIRQEESVMQESLENTLKKLKETMESVSLSIAQDLRKAEKEVSTISKNITKMHVNSKYEKIKSILVEQENKILILQVDMLKSASNLGSNPGGNFGSNTGKSLLFCHIPEETKNPRSDYQKVQEILKLFNGVSDASIEKVFRVGARTPRSLKVIFSNNESVDTILKQRRFLKNSPHSNVRIYDTKF